MQSARIEWKCPAVHNDHIGTAHPNSLSHIHALSPLSIHIHPTKLSDSEEQCLFLLSASHVQTHSVCTGCDLPAGFRSTCRNLRESCLRDRMYQDPVQWLAQTRSRLVAAAQTMLEHLASPAPGCEDEYEVQTVHISMMQWRDHVGGCMPRMTHHRCAFVTFQQM